MLRKQHSTNSVLVFVPINPSAQSHFWAAFVTEFNQMDGCVCDGIQSDGWIISLVRTVSLSFTWLTFSSTLTTMCIVLSSARTFCSPLPLARGVRTDDCARTPLQVRAAQNELWETCKRSSVGFGLFSISLCFSIVSSLTSFLSPFVWCLLVISSCYIFSSLDPFLFFSNYDWLPPSIILVSIVLHSLRVVMLLSYGLLVVLLLCSYLQASTNRGSDIV